MRSKTERRKVVLSLGTSLRAKGTVAAAALILSMFAVSANAQKEADAPLLSVFRKDAGVIHSDQAGRPVQTAKGIQHELVTGDFDADGVLDSGTFDPASRLFAVRRSSDGSTLVVSAPHAAAKYRRSSVAAADYDGDKMSDLAVWQAGVWHVMLSTRGYDADVTVFGTPGDVPVPADYDGDGRADFAVFRPAENRWYIRSSQHGTVSTHDFGIAGTDVLLPADYTGDGKADLAVYRSGVWHVINSENGIEETTDFGFDDARPVPGDFNRDGETEFALYRKGSWYIYDGSRLVSYKFGADEDVPLSLVSVRQSMSGL